MKLEATGGFEPPNRGFADPRLNHLATSPLYELPKLLLSARLLLGVKSEICCYLSLPALYYNGLITPDASQGGTGGSGGTHTTGHIAGIRLVPNVGALGG